jgi:tetratricopeptide (TPR) repeat protein
MMVRTAIVAGILGVASCCMGDVVTLQDGTRLEGNVRRAGDGWRITGDDGKVTDVPLSRVKSIEITPSERDASPRAADRLASLRRSVENLDAIEPIIERYERFIEAAGAGDVAEEAKKDLAQWRQRQAQGLTKHGQEWVTADQRLERIGRSLTLSHEARELMKQSRVSEAQPLLQEALAIHPQNATAIYLRGVLLYDQGKIVPARELFDQTRQIIPDHAPTLNNLAVIASRQNRLIGSLSLYHQALQLSKLSATILDNVAEALETVPQEQRGNPVVQRLSRAFNEQDAQLQAILAKQGLYRWGAVWVDREQIERLREAEREMQAKLEEMSREFDRTSQRIADIDNSIRETERTMRRIEAESYVRDSEGRLWRTPYPPIYQELERDVRNLKAERSAQVRKLEGLRESARRVKQELPVPQFTGRQRLIGIEGVPLMIPAEMPIEFLPPAMAAATQPPPVRQPPPGEAPSAQAPAETSPSTAPQEKQPPQEIVVPSAAVDDAFAPIQWTSEPSEQMSEPDPASTPERE